MEQAYIIWKCTGRADPAHVPAFREMRTAELAQERLAAIVAEHSKGKSE